MDMLAKQNELILLKLDEVLAKKSKECTARISKSKQVNVPAEIKMLKVKANELAAGIGEPSFDCSTGWIDRFKDRHGICFKKICGEAKSVDKSSDAMVQWADDLHTLLLQYNHSDIFNADETGIFYRMLPDRTLDFKGTDCHGGKRSKERLTALVCANMTGTEKLPLFTSCSKFWGF
ncbi:tigger transposable element-derived protein 6-like [Argopecten irradians]|uniref:tigger transposable element-derived protein 6-like n=1 Tax=Argopecten irradians TaxID=31199 RepID=UPI003719A2C2